MPCNSLFPETHAAACELHAGHDGDHASTYYGDLGNDKFLHIITWDDAELKTIDGTPALDVDKLRERVIAMIDQSELRDE